MSRREEYEDDDHGGRRRPGRALPGLQVGRAVILIVVGFIIGVIVLGKTNSVVLTSSTSTTSTSLPPTSVIPTTTRAPSETTSVHSSSGSTGRTTSTTIALKPASQVVVMVANGTTVPAAAARYATELGTTGYSDTKIADTTSPQSASAVYYISGYEANAGAIVSFLRLKQSAQPMGSAPPVSSVQGVDILVVLGPDLASSTTATSATSSP